MDKGAVGWGGSKTCLFLNNQRKGAKIRKKKVKIVEKRENEF